MRLPLTWLREYLPKLPTPAVLAETLVMHGFEVEEIIDRRHDFDHIVVGQIVGIRPHPNADKLRLAEVVVVPGGQPQEIVCGAPNIAIGQKVPVALLGAKLPNGMTIESRPIRGVVSNGMLCAEDELGLGQDHSGILVLDPATTIGRPFAAAAGFDEVVLDVSVPANRADVLSVNGLAYEIAAIMNVPLNKKRGQPPVLPKSSRKPLAVKVMAPKLSPIYTARVIRGVAVKPSPTWLQNKLRAMGVRPINAVVDATNYVMFDLGQPLHAFDAQKLRGGIVIRPATAKETLTTLDGQLRTLDPSVLIIADSRGPIALAGVMGGAETEIGEATTDIVLESATFDPVSVRRTARRFGLGSEASKRFERGVHRFLPEAASRTAAKLIVDLCGGRIEPGVATVGTAPERPVAITIAPRYISERLGFKVLPTHAKRLLIRLGFKVSGATRWRVVVPVWRPDVHGPDDIVDEIGRLVGYEKMPIVIPSVATLPRPLPALVQIKDLIQDELSRMGFTEMITHAYYGDQDQEAVGGEHVRVANPLDKTQQYLRRSLVPAVRRALEAAADAGQDVMLFELGRVFEPGDTQVTERQPWRLAVGLSTKDRTDSVPEWHVLGSIRALGQTLGVSTVAPLRLGHAIAKGRLLVWAEVDVAALRDAAVPRVYHVHPDTPPVVRDVSVEVPAELGYGTIEAKIMAKRIAHLESMTVVDAVARGQRRGLTVRLVFRAADHTLVKAEADAGQLSVVAALRELGVTVRA